MVRINIKGRKISTAICESVRIPIIYQLGSICLGAIQAIRSWISDAYRMRNQNKARES